LEVCGFAIRAQIVWAKPRLVLGRGDYHWQHEPCFYAVRKTAKVPPTIAPLSVLQAA
jgi:DNA modification methylase